MSRFFVIFGRLIVRPLRREWLRTLLTAFAVALGVGVVLAIELAGEAAAGSFRSSVETLTGDADFEVSSPGGIPPEVLGRLAQLPYDLELRPRIEDYATLVPSGQTVPLIGIDVLNDGAAGTSTQASTSASQGSGEFQDDNSIWAGESLQFTNGSRVRLLINDREAEFTVRGRLPKSSGDAIVMDLAPATRVLGRQGQLDRILVEVPSSRSVDEWERILRPALPHGVLLDRHGARTAENHRMLAAFRWNLRVLSYISLIVGAFLIYNTISVSVVRRRAEIGVVRALGATRGAVLAAFLGEAACFGLLGGVLGVIAGRLLAQGAVGLVSATVESLYVSSRPAPIALTWGLALLGVLIGVVVSVLSSLPPAFEASRVTPIEAMARGRREHEVRTSARGKLALAAALAVLGWVASRQDPISGKPVFGYLAALLLVAASALVTPALVAAVSSASAPVLRRLFGVEALLATRTLAGSLRRTAVLVAALSTAVSMTAAVGIMVGSFRQTVLLWMEDRLQADLYLRPAGTSSAGRHPTISPEAIERLRHLPEVQEIDRFRAYEISYNGAQVTLGGGEARVSERYGKRAFTSGTSPVQVFRRMASGGDAVIVSEPFATKHRVAKGDKIPLTLAGKRAQFEVLDVYNDYSSERGYIIMDRGTLLRYLPDPAPSNVAVYLRPGVELEVGRRAVQAALAGRRVLVFSNRSLREEAIRIFDRTFAITYALEAVAIFVAIMGIASALLALVIDRRREFGLLRFLGGATSQVRRLILFEAGLLGVIANLAGLALGVLLSLLLIFVINKQSFGWTIELHWPIATLLGGLLLVSIATVIAGLYPARTAARLNPIEVIHEE